MTGNELFREIGNISEELVLEAENYRKKAAFTGHDILQSGATGAAAVQQWWQKAIAGNAAARKTLTAAAGFVVCVGLVFLVQKTGIGFDAAKSESIADKAYNAEAFMEASKAPTNSMDAAEEELKEECAEEEGDVTEEETDTDLRENFNTEEAKAAQSELKDEVGNATGSQGSTEGAAPEESEKLDSMNGTEEYDVETVKERLAEYPNDYQVLLQEEDALVVLMGEVRNGQDKWDAFLEHVQAGEAAWVDVIVFSIEGDAIIRNIYFDGSVYHLCIDSTRDAYQGIDADPYYEETFRYLRRVEKKWESGTEVIEYVLTDQPEDGKEIDIDIKHCSVFQLYK